MRFSSLLTNSLGELSEVKIRFHRLVQKDLNRVLKGYSEVSIELENDFYNEFMCCLPQLQSLNFRYCEIKGAFFDWIGSFSLRVLARTELATVIS